jgi:uncharacterized paraquat-inducible protein A
LLTSYYQADDLTLSALRWLAHEHGLSLKKFLDLIQQHITPPKGAIRTCPGCGAAPLTASPTESYCVNCQKKLKRNRGQVADEMVYP